MLCLLDASEACIALHYRVNSSHYILMLISCRGNLDPYFDLNPFHCRFYGFLGVAVLHSFKSYLRVLQTISSNELTSEKYDAMNEDDYQK